MGSSSTTNTSQQSQGTSSGTIANTGTTSNVANGTQASNGSSSVWQPQQQYILNAFQQAQNNLTQQQQSGPYSGTYVASDDPSQVANYNAQNGFVNGTGASTVAGQLSAGQGQLTSGTEGQQGILSQLQNFGNTNQTANNIATAQQYAGAAPIAAQTQAAMNAVNENYNQNIVPSLYRNAAGSGNLNSDRAAIEQGVAQEGLNNEAGAIAGNLEGNAYNTGTSAALNQNAQSLQAQSQAGSLASTLAQEGSANMSSGIGNEGVLSNIGNTAGAGLTAAQQATDTNALDQFQGNNSYLNGILSQYMGIVGGTGYGQQTSNTGQTAQTSNGTSASNTDTANQFQQTGTGTSTTQNDPGILSLIGGGLGALGKLF